MPNVCYRCDWTHDRSEDPETIYYESDAEGVVQRIINVFADGRVACDSVEDYDGRENELPGFGSLVEGSFLDSVQDFLENGPDPYGTEMTTLVEINIETFDDLWRRYRA